MTINTFWATITSTISPSWFLTDYKQRYYYSSADCNWPLKTLNNKFIYGYKFKA